VCLKLVLAPAQNVYSLFKWYVQSVNIVSLCFFMCPEGEAHMISMVSQRIIHKYRFKHPVSCLRFSPDGKHFAACKDNTGK
jgi:hypothetical protein